MTNGYMQIYLYLFFVGIEPEPGKWHSFIFQIGKKILAAISCEALKVNLGFS